MYEVLLSDFLAFGVSLGDELFAPRKWYFSLAWRQTKEKLRFLGYFLLEIYLSPVSSAGMERKHRVNKKVHTYRRALLGEAKVEKHLSISYNEEILQQKLETKPMLFEKFIVNTLLRGYTPGNMVDEDDE